MYPEQSIDWHTFAGPKSYRAELVADAIGAVRSFSACANVDAATQFRFAVGNDHAGTVYPAALPASAILLDIAIASESDLASVCAFSILDDMLWFNAEPGFELVQVSGETLPLLVAIQRQICSARGQLEVLASSSRASVAKMASALLQTLDERSAELGTEP